MVGPVLAGKTGWQKIALPPLLAGKKGWQKMVNCIKGGRAAEASRLETSSPPLVWWFGGLDEWFGCLGLR